MVQIKEINVQNIMLTTVPSPLLTLPVWYQEEHPACKNLVMTLTWFLSRAGCKRFAYGSADANATPPPRTSLKSRIAYCFDTSLAKLSWNKSC